MGDEAFEGVLEFWFGEHPSLAKTIEKQSPLWWGKNADTDNEIERRFKFLLQRFKAGELDDWKQNAEGWLALILLSDQFTRNIYRDTGAAFSLDQQALALCLEGIEKGIDIELNPLQRVFFYLPLEHAESMSMQERSLKLQRHLLDNVDASLKPAFEGFYKYALAHKEVIEQFGRYPHRNTLLGRESTKEELEYLAQPGSGF